MPTPAEIRAMLERGPQAAPQGPAGPAPGPQDPDDPVALGRRAGMLRAVGSDAELTAALSRMTPEDLDAFEESYKAATRATMTDEIGRLKRRLSVALRDPAEATEFGHELIDLAESVLGGDDDRS